MNDLHARGRAGRNAARPRATRGACLAALLVIQAATWADDPAPAGPPPETIRVEGEAEETPVDLTAFRSTIRAPDFDRRFATLGELLSETVGVRVRSFGALGAFATVSIRGSTAEQVNVYLDGIPLNSALGGGVNLSDIPIDDIASIDIYRGLTPSWLPGGSIGGAIDIRTRRPATGDRSFGGQVSFGSHDTATGAARGAWSGERVDAALAVSGRTTEGDFRFFDNNGTPETGSDDGYTIRTNNDSWLAELHGTTGVKLEGGGRAVAQALITRRRQGVPGIDAFQSETARSAMTRTLLRAGIEGRAFASGALRLDAFAHYGWTGQEFSDRAGDTTGGISTDARDTIRSVGPDILLRWNADREGALRQDVSWHASTRVERADRHDRLAPIAERGEATRRTHDLALEDALHVAGGRVVLTPAIRFTAVSSSVEVPPGVPAPADPDAGDARWSPRLGAAIHLGPAASLRANVGRFYRVPTFTEFFGDAASIRANPSLLPEEGVNADLGVIWEAGSRGVLDHLHVEAVLFRSLATNLIQFVQTSQSQVIAVNTGDARITGAEISTGLGLWGWLTGGINYTYQQAEDRSDTFSRGSELPGRPVHEVSARAAAHTSWGRPYYEFDYIGPNWFDSAAAALAGSGIDRDLLRVPGRYFHSAGCTLSAGPRLEYMVEITNIFNVKSADIVRYPLPGRMVQAGIRWVLP